MANKIKYGLSNCYYAKITAYDSETGKYTYAAPKRIAGAVNLSLSATGSDDPFYADNIIYSTTTTNAGYQGDAEFALIPDSFREEILGEVKDEETGMYLENTDAVTSEFALLFQFEGDANATRHVMYRCKATRPNVESSTKEDTATPNTETLSLTCMARENDHIVKGRCATAEAAAYEDFFTAVVEPTPKA